MINETIIDDNETICECFHGAKKITISIHKNESYSAIELTDSDALWLIKRLQFLIDNPF